MTYVGTNVGLLVLTHAISVSLSIKIVIEIIKSITHTINNMVRDDIGVLSANDEFECYKRRSSKMEFWDRSKLESSSHRLHP